MLPNLHYWQCYASSGPTGLARGVLKTLGFVKAVGRLMLPEAAKLRAELHGLRYYPEAGSPAVR